MEWHGTARLIMPTANLLSNRLNDQWVNDFCTEWAHKRIFGFTLFFMMSTTTTHARVWACGRSGKCQSNGNRFVSMPLIWSSTGSSDSQLNGPKYLQSTYINMLCSYQMSVRYIGMSRLHWRSQASHGSTWFHCSFLFLNYWESHCARETHKYSVQSSMWKSKVATENNLMASLRTSINTSIPNESSVRSRKDSYISNIGRIIINSRKNKTQHHFSIMNVDVGIFKLPRRPRCVAFAFECFHVSGKRQERTKLYAQKSKWISLTVAQVPKNVAIEMIVLRLIMYNLCGAIFGIVMKNENGNRRHAYSCSCIFFASEKTAKFANGKIVFDRFEEIMSLNEQINRYHVSDGSVLVAYQRENSHIRFTKTRCDVRWSSPPFLHADSVNHNTVRHVLRFT